MEANAKKKTKPLSDTVFESDAVFGTPLWDVIFNPNHDVATIRTNGLIIKVKDYFIRENANCSVILHSDKIFIMVTITDGRIDEYEILPARICGSEFYAPVAWLFKNSGYEKLNHKRLMEV